MSIQLIEKLSGLSLSQYQDFYMEDLQEIACDHNSQIIPGQMCACTSHHIMQRRCSVLDNKNMAQEEARIPPSCADPYLIYMDWNSFSNTGLTRQQAENQFLRAFGGETGSGEGWANFIDLQFRFTNDRTVAHCLVDWARLSGSILAWSNLANNTCSKSQQQRYDIRGWSEHLLFLTVLHELGHLLGLGHLGGNYIMNPSILTQLSGLTPTDISRARGLGYGPAPDRPDPVPTNDGLLIIKDNELRISVSNNLPFNGTFDVLDGTTKAGNVWITDSRLNVDFNRTNGQFSLKKSLDFDFF